MSGSPKYSHAELMEQQERRLAEQRRQRALAEERLRQQREAEEQQRQLEHDRHQQLMQWTERQTTLASQCAVHGRYAAASWKALDTQLATGRMACEQARSLSQIQSARQHLDMFDLELAVAVGRARAEAEAERLQRERERAAAVARAQAEAEAERLRRERERRAALLNTDLLLARSEHAALHSQGAELDPRGAAAAQSALEHAEDFLRQGQLDDAERALETARTVFGSHQAEIRRRLAERSAARAAAETALSALRRKISGIEADEVVMAWCRSEVAEVNDQCARAAAALTEKRFAASIALCEQATRSLSWLLEKSEQRQLEEERRSYLVSSLIEVLRQQEFLVSDPQLARADDLDSTVVIHATRPDRRAILMQVPTSGPVSYDVDGYSRRIESGPSGPSATCDEAEARLEAIHAQLEADFGIRMGELQWDGRDPQRRSRDGRPLPSSAAQSKQRGN